MHEIECLEEIVRTINRYIPPNRREVPACLRDTVQQLEREGISWEYQPYGSFDYQELIIYDVDDVELWWIDNMVQLFIGSRCIDLEDLDTNALSHIGHSSKNKQVRLALDPHGVSLYLYVNDNIVERRKW
jgi:hypothetical protein